MKRPGVKQKKTGNPEEEPDFYKISNLHPLPEKAADDSILLECTVQGGPKARMPIYTGVPSSASFPSATVAPTTTPAVAPVSVAQTPFRNPLAVATPAVVLAPAPVAVVPAVTAAPVAAPESSNCGPVAPMPSMAFPAFPAVDPAAMAQFPGFVGMDQASAAQFAAGFAMAAAYSQQHFMNSMMGQLNATTKQQPTQQSPKTDLLQ